MEPYENAKESFSNKLRGILNYGALNLGMGIGYRLGLFDVMDALDAPEPVSVIAENAGLSVRYIKEWLGVMVTGDIVELSQGDSGQDLFYLPRPHADLITRRAGNSNLGVYTQEIPLLTWCAIEPVVEGFRTGQGVTYDHYPKFQAFMSELADAKHRQVLVNRFLPYVDNGRLIHRLNKGISVCDLGCAEGVAVLLMARAFPKSCFVGMDISKEVVSAAREEALRQNIPNAAFHALDAAELSGNEVFRDCFKYVTAFDAIHDQTRPLEALKGVYHILKQGGCFSMIDIAAGSRLADNKNHSMGPFLYTVSLMHCMPVGLADGGAGLGMMWGREKAVEMLNQAGFKNVQVLDIPDDPFNLHFFCIK
jgi:ubiquinone/menaquinone biosynthesis C-methylase UbiE